MRNKTAYLLIFSGIILSAALPSGLLGGFGSLYDLIIISHLVLFGALIFSSINDVSSCFKSRRTAKTVIALLPIFAVLPLCLLPPTATDALVHHLAVPKWWLKAGRIIELPDHEWSYYPMLGQLVYVDLLKYFSDQCCAVYHWSYLLVISGLVACIAKELKFSEIQSLLALIFTSFLPVWLRLAATPLVDLVLVAFVVAGILFLLKEENSELKASNYIFAGLALGLSISAKYNGLLASAAILISLPLLVRNVRKLTGGAVLVISGMFLTAAPWFMRNLLWTGNPLYPLFRGTLGGHVQNLAGAPKGLSPLMHRILVYGESNLDILLLPVRIFFQGADGDPSRFDGVLSPLLVLSIFAVLSLKQNKRIGFLLLTTICYVAGALYFSAARIRYLAPIIPCFSVLAVVGATNILHEKLRERALALLCTAQVALGFIYLRNLYLVSDAKAFYLNNESRDSYLSRRVGDYELISIVNSTLSDSAKVYLLYTPNHFYYFNKAIMSRGYYSGNEIIAWLRSGLGSDDLKGKFAALGVSHLFIGSSRLLSSFSTALSPEQGKVWNEFQSAHLKLIESKGEYSLWELI